ncbi:hypothetical protein K450DRAFT_264074 [Umbelopsis ramanniana AG]|uniref:Uncharacterized protein n=1 Tax=Umbelopsis ramanniana AG TaxID=1314678 RepID=A0AAD5H9F0_UMBRA|nr:uncharacterized protein K450DRAFT_264074 [Umbelopsis ramanniana AG]KAI8574934.1 hypothetical protein K450DRAFT_264074 [Umbelopsis ramanniana AG]
MLQLGHPLFSSDMSPYPLQSFSLYVSFGSNGSYGRILCICSTGFWPALDILCEYDRPFCSENRSVVHLGRKLERNSLHLPRKSSWVAPHIHWSLGFVPTAQRPLQKICQIHLCIYVPALPFRKAIGPFAVWYQRCRSTSKGHG